MIPSPRQVEQKSKERDTRGCMEDTLLNLCVEPFVVRCEATSVNADGYPPSNLISSDRAARARGFQMEHFVRPPVTLEVNVSRRVRVAFLVLHVPLPEGAECRLEVFGSPGGEGDGPYTHCAGVTLKDCDVLFLRNRSYVGQIADGVPSATKVIGSYLPPDLSDRDRMEQPFKSCSALAALRRLKVSVSWLSGHLPLKVKAMELWGIPCERDVARGLSDSLRERTADCRFTNVFNSRSFGGEEDGGSVSLVHGSRTTLCTRCASCGSDQCACDPHGTFLGTLERGEREEEEGKGQRLDSKGDCPFFLRGTDRAQSVAATPTTLAPSRLLDELTCDVMQVPMLLPSGHYVDQSTVDKLEQMDLLYGRRPCDPFTGVPFSATSQPAFCAQLKCQLDAFLSSNITSSGMTVGGSKDILGHLGRTGGREKRQADNTGSLKPSKKLREDFEDLGTKFDLAHLPGLTLSDPVLNSAHDHTVTTSEGTQSRQSRKCGHSQQDLHEEEVERSLTQALGTLYSSQPCHSPPDSRN